MKPGGQIAAADAGRISRKWRQDRVLVPATLEILPGHSLVDLRDVAVRREIRSKHGGLFPRGRHLDLDLVVTPQRKFTQALRGELYKEGAAGILYVSKLYGTCLALFEPRAKLILAGPPEPLTDSFPDFEQVCRDLGLTLV
jgi:RES domain